MRKGAVMIRDALRTLVIAALAGVVFAAGFLYLVVTSGVGERGWCSPGPFQTQCE
jgi:hypothetical protein